MAVLGKSLVGKMRVNAARVDYCPLNVVMQVSSSPTWETLLQKNTLSIVDELPSGGNTAQARCRFSLTGNGGTDPKSFPGRDIKIFLGTAANRPIFGGTIVRFTQRYESGLGAPRWDADVNGYWWLLNRRLVNKPYVNTSITAIVADILTTFSSGFTSTYVQAGLPATTIAFSFSTISDAFTALATIAGAIWFVDAAKNVCLFTPGNDPRPQPATVTGANALKLAVTWDLQPTRTRVYANVSGASGITVIAPISAGSGILPVSNAFPFVGGTRALLGTPTASGNAAVPILTREDLIAYTGTSSPGTPGPAALVSPPGSIANITVNWTTGGVLAAGANYKYAFTYATSNGETTPSPTVNVVSANTKATLSNLGSLYVAVQSITRPPDSSTTAINVYRTVANGSQLLYAFQMTGASGWPSSVVDSTADGSLGQPAPLTNTAAEGRSSTTVQAFAAIGSGTVYVNNCGVLNSAGGYLQFGSDVIVGYSGYSVTSAPIGYIQLLTTLVSGLGVGTTVTAIPVLTGVSGIPVPVNIGATVSPFVQLDDTAAQTALATVEGGDGIQEFYLADDGALTAALATTIGLADLALWKSPVESAALESRDPYFAAGVQMVVNVAGGPTMTAIAAPATAPVATLQGGAPGFMGSGNYAYAVTFISGGETTGSPVSNTVTTGALAAPASAPTLTALVNGAGVDSGVHLYAMTYVVGAGETTPSPTLSVTTGTGTMTPPPSLTNSSVGGGGSMAPGNFFYVMTYTAASGETTYGAYLAVTLPGGDSAIGLGVNPGTQVGITGRNVYRWDNVANYRLAITIADNTTTFVIDTAASVAANAIAPASGTATTPFNNVSIFLPGGPAGVTALNVYRTTAGGGQLKFLTTIAYNANTIYTDAASDASLGANAPAVNTVTSLATFVTIPVGPVGVTNRKLYRTTVGGSQLKFLYELPDNVATGYGDNAPDAALGANIPTVGTAAASLIAHRVTRTRFEEGVPVLLPPVCAVEASTAPVRLTLEGVLTQIGKPVTRVGN